MLGLQLLDQCVELTNSAVTRVSLSAKRRRSFVFLTVKEQALMHSDVLTFIVFNKEYCCLQK